MRTNLLFLVLVFLLGSGSSCSNSMTAVKPTRQTGIELAPTDLWPLVSGQGFYELWIGVPAELVPEGEDPWGVAQDWTASAPFRIDGLGKVRDLRGELIDRFPIPRDLATGAIARAVITYQSSGDAGGPHPMGEWLAIGDFVAPGGTISSLLSWDSPEVFDKDLTALAGSVRMRTETDPDGPLLPNGLWFYEPADSEPGSVPAASLELGEALLQGYVYESWVFQRALNNLMPQQLFSLGRYLQANGADSDGAGPYATLGAPFAPFPGQDFVVDEPREFDDGSWTVMVTIEPLTDPMPRVPSSLRVLERAIDVGDGLDVALEFTNRAANDRLPKVLVTIVR
jgi:hypothetical protein